MTGKDTDSADRPVLDDSEIEITPQMISAGIAVLFWFDREGDSGKELVAAVYRANTGCLRMSGESPMDF